MVPEEVTVDSEITRLLEQLRLLNPSEENYAAVSAQLERLYRIKDNNRPDQVSANTKALIAANLFGTLMVLHYEQAHVLTSKAFSLILKARS